MSEQTITKMWLSKYIAEAHDLTAQQAKLYVDAFFEGLSESIIQGKRIEIRGFGAWHVIETREKRRAQNPRTGERVYVPPRRKVLFKSGQILKQVLARPLEEVDT